MATPVAIFFVLLLALSFFRRHYDKWAIGLYINITR